MLLHIGREVHTASHLRERIGLHLLDWARHMLSLPSFAFVTRAHLFVCIWRHWQIGLLCGFVFDAGLEGERMELSLLFASDSLRRVISRRDRKDSIAHRMPFSNSVLRTWTLSPGVLYRSACCSRDGVAARLGGASFISH